MSAETVRMIFPPMFPPFQPYPSLPVLAAAAGSAGIRVSGCDLNLWTHEALVSPRYAGRLLLSGTRCSSPGSGSRQGTEGTIADAQHGLEMLRTEAAGPRPGASDYLEAIQAINLALREVGSRFDGVTLQLGRASMPYSPQHSSDIVAATRDHRRNPFIEMFADHIEETRTELADAMLIGVSIVSLSQVIPAFTYLALLRDSVPETPFVVGGPVLTRVSDKLMTRSGLFDLFDFVVLGEGETALIELVHQLQAKREFASVPNLLYRQSGQLVRSRVTHVEDLNAWPAPRYEVLPVTQYLSPRPTLSVPVARGCYWGKCMFCNQHVVSGGCFRERDASLVADDILTLSSTHGAEVFCLGTESLRPAHGREIAERLIVKGARIVWYAGSRLDERLLLPTLRKYAESGCFELMFGLESGSQRVLDAMRKGTNVLQARQIVRDCADVGIPTHLFLMVGFPGEEPTDVIATADFVAETLSSGLPEVSCWISRFQAVHGAPVTHQLRENGWCSPAAEAREDLAYILPLTRSRPGSHGPRWAERRLEEAAKAHSQPDCVKLPVEFRMALRLACKRQTARTVASRAR
jgi:anaerobic magnesium-protoporphyrin IX monomethyl ester cyclase